MKKTLSIVLLAAAALACDAAAQDPVAAATRQSELQALSTELHQRDQQDRQKVQDYARQLGIPVRRELTGGRVLELQRVVPGLGPVFYLTCNIDAADTVSTDEVWPGGSAGLDLDGSGMTVAEWDGGAIYDHPDLAGRVTQMDGASLISGHSTHVAGTLIASGDWLLPDARGMAYAAQLEAWDWNSDTAEMAAAAASGQLVSNHSYGIAAGWLYIGDLPPDTWWWIGGEDPEDVEDPNFGYYDAESQLWDQIAYDAPYYLPVKAAGNDRSDIGPAPGEEYTVINQDGEFQFTSTLPRQPDCAPAGYDCLPTHSVAKNILTVGAVDDVPGGYSELAGPAAVTMADFSGWGPTDDGRIKPDLVGNGVLLYSTWPDYPYYALAAGTSMSAPNVTGSLLLLQQHYQDLHGPGNFMRGATLKALAIHTADESGDDPGPDYAFGWGLFNTKSAAEIITEDGGDHRIIEASLTNGGVNDHVINVVDAEAVITATLVWADPPGTPVAPSLDPPDLMLVNDLDLRILKGPSTYFPWILDPANPAAAATTGDNIRDNVEQVEVSGAGAGTYTIRVSHKGALQGGAAQDYSLIISVNPPPPTGSGFLIDEDFSDGMPAGWTVDTPQGVDWTVNDPVPGDPRLDNNTGGSGRFAMVDNYFARTLTSLRTPLLDLSIHDTAILRFRSYFYMDTYESINVDTSTDGGASWSNAWQWSGFNPYPTQYVVDLSGAIAGHTGVMLRFRYNTYGEPQGNLWQVDDVELEVFGGGGDPPGQASAPVPADGATGLGIDTDISWTPGSLADSHDVYFGTAASLGPGDFQGNQAATSFDPGLLANDTTFYWRIDEVNDDGTTAGATWSFTTEGGLAGPPGQASTPSPADGATGQATDTDISWAANPLATSHDVYFGTAAPLGPGDFQGNQAAASFDPGLLTDGTTYYWRIDEVNDDGTTAGATWSFSTEAAAPAPPGPASNPDPANGATGLGTETDVSWSADPLATSHDVYFGTDTPLGLGDFRGNQAATTYDPGPLADGTTYYWRIDEVNDDGTTDGTTWSFTTAAAPPPVEAMHLAGLGGSALPPVKGRWTAVVEISVEDDGFNPESGVTVEGDWSDGANGSTTCDTSGGGICTVQKANLKGNVASVTFTVTNLVKSGMTYEPDGNVGGDSVVVSQTDTDQTPSAANDSYSTDVNLALNGNVMDNDNPGDAPATIESHTLPVNGALVLGSDGAFTYTPDTDFEGEDSFTYRIADTDGDLSNTATVTITVSAAEPPPPPPPPGELLVTASPYKVKGVQHVDLTWENFEGPTVGITRNTTPLTDSPTDNDGEYVDNIGEKGGGEYTYEVCETTDTSNCASATATF